MKKLLVVAASLFAFESAAAQRVVYDTFVPESDYVVNHQLCCSGSPATQYFYYSGPTAELHSLAVDARMYYEGHLRVSFYSSLSGQFQTLLQTWTGRDFSEQTPLFFDPGIQLSSNSEYAIELIPEGSTGYQGIESAAVWTENLEGESLYGFGSKFTRVVVKVPEPATLWPLSVPLLLLGLARFRRQAGRRNS